jgi:3-oxoacyl-[acyl-carrier protein] reductase
MNLSLNDKVVLVTGGSRGIGRSIVLACADAGANVAFTYKSAGAAAEEVKSLIESKGRKALALQSDAGDFNAANAAVEMVVKELGRIDVLVNNAGITKDTLLMRMNEQDWDLVIDTNLKSTFNFAKAVCRPMMGQRSGNIINISSITGVIGNAGQVNYAAAKAGMIGLTKTLAKELASRNIQVNAVAPGFVVEYYPHEAYGETRGDRECCRVPRFVCRQLHHRTGAVRGRRYRHVTSKWFNYPIITTKGVNQWQMQLKR